MTAMGAPRGFFTQYPYLKQLAPVGETYPEVEGLCEQAPYRAFLDHMAGFREVFAGFGAQPTDPVLGRGMFPALDGMAAYAAIRGLKPRRIVEVGCGDSTYFLARAVRDNGFGAITCIDPQPRRDIRALSVTYIPRLLTNADAELTAQLDANDVLFIDSSHIMLPGMDVDIMFNRMFPRLKTGVVVHVHDIFLPDDYPPTWRPRNYSEQNALMGWLLSGAFEIIWPGHYALTRHPELVAAADLPARPVSAGSLWLRRV